MQYIKDGKISTDGWLHADASSPLPAAGDVIVPLARWLAEREQLLSRSGRIGVRLASSEGPEPVREDLQHIALIALEFPSFRDGRAYSYARILREQYGFRGELRAVGNVLYDQFMFMHRCGINAYEVQKDGDAERFARALTEFTVRYQPGEETPSAIELRHAPGHPPRSAGARS